MQCRTWIVVALVMSIASVDSSLAEGKGGYFPDLISARQLDQYAGRLRLSKPQAVAASEIHATYCRDYEALRDGDIAEFLDIVKNGMLTRKRVREHDRLWDRLVAIDNQFFDQLQTILADEQVVLMPRVRLARQRDRFSQYQLLWDWGWRPSDLSEMIADIELGVDERNAIDPMLASYESTLITRLREINEAYTKLLNECCDALAAAGFSEADLANPGRADDVKGVSAAFWRDNGGQMLGKHAKLAAFNRAEVRRLMEALRPSSARSLRYTFFRLYLGNDLLPDDANRFNSLLVNQNLTDEQRLAIESAAGAFDAQLDSILEEFAERWDEYRARFAPSDIQNMPQETRTERTQFRIHTKERLQKVRTQATEAVEASGALGSKVVAPSNHSTDGSTSPSQNTAATNIGRSREILKTFAPAPIDKRDLDAIRHVFQLDAETASAIHGRYLQQFDDATRKELATLNRFQGLIYRDGHFNKDTLTLEAVQYFTDLRKAALASITSIEERFFIDMADAAGLQRDDSVAQRVRDSRLRSWQNQKIYGARFGQYGPGQRNDCSIDLSTLLRERLPLITTDPRVDAILREYEAKLTPLLTRKFEALLRYDDAEWRTRAEWLVSVQNDPGSKLSSASRVDEHAQQDESIIVISNDAISTLNAQFLERLLVALPSDSAFSLQRDCERLSFPRIFDDAAWAGPLFDHALRLDTLTDDQRTILQQTAAEYLSSYNQACRTMEASVDTHASITYGPDDGDTTGDREQRVRIRLKLAFDRNELSARAINRIRAVLNEEQIQTMGALPPAADFAGQDYGW